jgi:hypothetical protein
MSRPAIALLAASVIVAFGATVSTDAFAYKKVHHRAAAVAVVAPAPVPVVFIDNNYGPVASGIPRCFDSAVYYPLPPCY